MPRRPAPPSRRAKASPPPKPASRSRSNSPGRRAPEPRLRQEVKQQTREALIDAGIALFREQGLDAPSLDAICERAGYTRGAFYVHFQDRDEFLVAVMDRIGEPFLDAVLGPASGDRPGAAATEARADLPTIMLRFVAAASSGAYPLIGEGGVRPHHLIDACLRSPVIRARYLELLGQSAQRLASGVQAGQAAGTVRKDVDAEQLAALLLAAVIGAQTMLELRAPLDLPGAASTLLRVLGPAH